MHRFTEPWIIVILLLSFLGFVEGLHMYEHQHCRDPCSLIEEDY